MKTTFVELKSTDKITMHGLLFEPNERTNKIVIHHHGMEGNFYENTFIPIMAKTYTEAGISFLSYNNRGHDYICDLKINTADGINSMKGGTAFENIADNAMDIEGAINFCKHYGYEKIILQGHSSGANKVVYAIANNSLDIYATILISPCDDYGLYIDEVSEKERLEYRALAKQMISKGDGNKYMPENAYMGTLISARTFLECSMEGSAIDMFPYRDAQNSFDCFSKVKSPIFVSFGTNGDYLLQDFNYVIELLNDKKATEATISFNLIEGAAHNYIDYEQELAEHIVNWIGSLN